MKTLYKMLGYFDMRVLSEKVWLPVADRLGPWLQTASVAVTETVAMTAVDSAYCGRPWLYLSTVISYV